MAITRKDSTITWIVMCAIIFCIFSFEYIYCYQSRVIAFAQHVLSDGKGQYNPVLGAVLVTVVAMLLQLGTLHFTRLSKHFHALTYFPSMLFLAALTSFHRVSANNIEWDNWIWFTPLYLIIYAVIIYLLRHWLPEHSTELAVLYSTQLTLNLLILVLMMIFVCI